MQKVEIDFGYEEVIGDWMGREVKCCTTGGTIYGYAVMDLTKEEPVQSFELEDIICPVKFIRNVDGIELEQTYHQEYDTLYQALMNKVEEKYITVAKSNKEIA